MLILIHTYIISGWGCLTTIFFFLREKTYFIFKKKSKYNLQVLETLPNILTKKVEHLKNIVTINPKNNYLLQFIDRKVYKLSLTKPQRPQKSNKTIITMQKVT